MGLLLLGVGAARADLGLTPFDLPNADPVRAFLGEPRWGAAVAPEKAFEFRAGVTLANQYTADVAGDEQIVVDVEVNRLDVSARWRLPRNWAVGLSVPIVRTSGGFLDGFIDGWHDTFGLPTGGRKARPRDEYEISYLDNGAIRSFAETGTGLGDVAIDVSGPLGGLRWAAAVELPTGDEDELRGSGALAANLIVLGQGDFGDRWGYYWGAGLSYGRGSPIAPDRFERWRAGGVFGAGRDLTASLRVKAELAWMQAPYDSRTKALGRDALPLIIGAEWRAGKVVWELGLAEDLSVNASPDIAFLVSVRYRPRDN